MLLFSPKKLKITGLSILFFALSSSSFAQARKWTLEECIVHALENNIQIQQSKISQKISEQNYLQSKFTVLPNLNGDASHSYNYGQRIDPFTNEFATERVRSNSLSISSSFTIFNGFQTLNSIRQNEANLSISKYDLQQIENDVSLNITNFFLQILFSKEFLRNADNQMAVTAGQVARIQKLVDAGSLPEGDLREIEAQLASDELQQINAQNQLTLTVLNLAQLLRFENNDNFDIQTPNLEEFKGGSELITPGALYLTALDIMPEIKRAEYRFYSSEKAKDIAQGGYSPTLSLTGSLGSGYSGANQELVGFENARLLPNGNITVGGDPVLSPTADAIRKDKTFGTQLDENFNKAVGFRLSIPLFNGLSARSNVQRAKLNMQSEELNLENAKLQLRQNIETAHTDAVSALKRYKVAEKSVNALELSFKYTQERFDVGMVNSFEFSTELNRLNNANSELLQAKYEYIFKTKVLDFYQGRAITL